MYNIMTVCTQYTYNCNYLETKLVSSEPQSPLQGPAIFDGGISCGKGAVRMLQLVSAKVLMYLWMAR